MSFRELSDMPTSDQKVIAAALAEVGYHEGRSGGQWNNDNKFAHELNWANKQAWCATFVCAMFRRVGLYDLLPVKSPGCDQMGDGWKKAGRWSEYPAVGAQVFFGTPGDLSHTGIVEKYDDTYIYTVEGNTNATGARQGDGVYRLKHERRSARVIGYGYPKYREGIDSADPRYQDKDPEPQGGASGSGSTIALPIHGADISHHQAKVDLPVFKKSGGQWVYHKATEGTGWTDDRYAERRKAAQASGLPFGAYHFARPRHGDGAKQARRFLRVAAPKPGDLIPMLDLETNDVRMDKADLTAWVGDWVAVVRRATGVLPIIYTPYDLLDNFGCKLWVARYHPKNAVPRVPAPWDQWHIRQFSNGVYGVPKSAPGLGNVDLNCYGRGVTLTDLLIPTKKPPAPAPVKKPFTLRYGHCSMQYSDTPKQKLADAKVLFGRGNHILTGTEAGEDPLASILEDQAEASGYLFHRSRGEWVAVLKSLVTSGWETGYVPVIESTEGAGRHSDRGIVWASFDAKGLGRITVGAGHYLTRGRTLKDPNYTLNQEYAAAIGTWGEEAGRGSALVFYSGDQNTVDSVADTFHGAPFTSAWDELGTWDNTGHGNIDVIASYDRDGRVTATDVHAFTDREVFLNTDHFLVEASFSIQTSQTRKAAS